MKSKKMIAVLTAAMLTTTIFAGCGKTKTADNPGGGTTSESSSTSSETSTASSETSSSSSTEETKEAEADKDGHVTFLGIDPETLDPSRSSDTYGAYIVQNITEGLTFLQCNEKGQAENVNAAAEKIDISPDGMVWTFTLRDFNWSDGQKVTAKDYEYGIMRTLDPNTASQTAAILYPIKGAEEYFNKKGPKENVGVKALDEKTLQITLGKPCAYFKDLTHYTCMMPQRKDYVEKYGSKYGSTPETMPVCGPFMLKEWTPKSQVVFEKNPNYWDADSVKLKTITLRVIKEDDTAMQELEKAGLDSAGVNKKEWMGVFDKKEDMDHITGFTGGTAYKLLNQKNEYLKNAKIRKALSISYDRKGYVDNIMGGIGEPAFAFVPPGLLIGDKEFRAMAPENPIEKLIKDNPDPKKLFIDGLKEMGKDPDPSKVKITALIANESSRAKLGAELEQQFWQKALGFKMNLELLQWNQYVNRTKAGDYDIGGQAWNPDYNDPMTFMDLFITSNPGNKSHFSNPKYDEIIDKASKLPGTEEGQQQRAELFKQAEYMLLYDEAGVIPTFYQKRNTYRYKYVKNVQNPITSPGSVLKNIYTTRGK